MPAPWSSSPLIKISGIDDVDGERTRAGEDGRVRACVMSDGDRLRGLRARGAMSATLSVLSKPQSLLDRLWLPGGARSGSPPTLSMLGKART